MPTASTGMTSRMEGRLVGLPWRSGWPDELRRDTRSTTRIARLRDGMRGAEPDPPHRGAGENTTETHCCARDSREGREKCDVSPCAHAAKAVVSAAAPPR